MNYDLLSLAPLSVSIDEDSVTHVIYELPRPKPWMIRTRIGSHEYRTTLTEEQYVTKIRVCTSTCDPLNICTVIVPYDETGRESPLSSVIIDGPSSFVTAFARLGIYPELPLN